MGYYTSYSLDIVEGDHELIKELVETNEHAAYAIDVTGDTESECKWYSCEEDLKDFSAKHPDALFKLRGEGEESGDIWEAYFKNGKMQMCPAKIVFDDYDESKLE